MKNIFQQQEDFARQNGGYLPGNGTIEFVISDYPLDLNGKISPVAQEKINQLEKSYPGQSVFLGDKNSIDVKALHIVLS